MKSLGDATGEAEATVRYAFFNADIPTFLYGKTAWFSSTTAATAAQTLLNKPDTMRDIIFQSIINDPNFVVQSSHAQPGTVGDRSVYVTIRGRDTESGMSLNVQTYAFIRGRVLVVISRLTIDFEAMGLNAPENDIALEDLARLLDLRAQQAQGMLP